MGRTALVLGAGLGGISAAQSLRRALPHDDRVVLVDRAGDHIYQASLPWVLAGSRDLAQISRPAEHAARRGIEFIHGEIESISAAERSATIDGRELRADALIIALGAEYNPGSVPGLAEAGHCFYTAEGAVSGHQALSAFNGGRIAFLTAAPQYKCPAAPYEAALLVDGEFRRRGLRGSVQIDFYAAEAGPMLTAGAEVSAAIRQLIESRGITYHPGQSVAGVDVNGRRLRFANGDDSAYDLLFYVPPHRAPVVIREAGLTNESGWIPVDRHTLATKYEGVYAIGDVVVLPLKMGRPLPKAGVFAHAHGDVVAHNLAVGWTGRGALRHFDGVGACFVETGDGRAGIGHGNFYAEPLPTVKLRQPHWLWHGAKVLYEKYWLHSRF
jgi:sulfide:quinone oxidoreductase